MARFQPEPFGRYYLIDRMAVGGMAEIFRGTYIKDGGFQRLVCIKRILEHLSDDHQFIEMFGNEARITVQLTHPNIVQCYDFDRIRDHYYIAMEYVAGKDLRALLKSLGKRGEFLPADLGAYIGHEAARGLHYAHERKDLQGNPLNIVHRDVSPANLLLSYEGNVKVADFGIAKAQSNLGHTRTGTLKGKFEYMSPEQLELVTLDGRSDIFALGVVLYNVLTGRRLFKGKNDLDTLENVRNSYIDPPSKFNPDISERLDEIVLRALARDRDERYLTARDLAEDLADFLYPVTPDQMKDSLAAVMEDHFGDDKTEELSIIDQGTRLAQEAWDQPPELDMSEDWALPPQTGTETIVISPSALPWIGGGLAHFVVWLVALVVWAVPNTPANPQGNWDSNRYGSVVFSVDPDVPVQLLINDVVVAEGVDVISYNKLIPQVPIDLTLKADGYAPHKLMMSPSVGEQRTESVLLTQQRPAIELSADDMAEGGEPVEQKAPELERPGLYFTSQPTGADVFVDGSWVGETPHLWTQGNAGVASYKVRFEKAGYSPTVKQASFPREGRRQLQAVLQTDGTPGVLEISVGNGGARSQLFLDGKSLGWHSMLDIKDVRPGKHEIKAVDSSGRTDSRVVRLEPGTAIRVQLHPE